MKPVLRATVEFDLDIDLFNSDFSSEIDYLYWLEDMWDTMLSGIYDESQISINPKSVRKTIK